MNLAAKHDAGLDLAGLGDLASMLDEPARSGDLPRLFSVAVIHEDEGNSRQRENPGFSKESIAELAASIRERGIKSPLSLRPDPARDGCFIINHGHRRYRAAVVAGLSEVPAFVDESFDEFDQMIENIQRENLTAREISDFIGGQLAAGKTQAEIASLLGKSKAYVSQHVKLLDLPEPVAQAFNSGRVRDVTVANELARAHRENPVAVEAALSEVDGTQADGLAAKPITRASVERLRTTAKRKAKAGQRKKPRSIPAWPVAEQRLGQVLSASVAIEETPSDGSIKVSIMVENAEQLRRLLTTLGCELAD